MEFIGKLNIKVAFGTRYFQSGKCDWGGMARNMVNRRLFLLVPTARGYTKLEVYLAEIKKLRFRSFGGASRFWRNFGSWENFGINSRKRKE